MDPETASVGRIFDIISRSWLTLYKRHGDIRLRMDSPAKPCTDPRARREQCSFAALLFIAFLNFCFLLTMPASAQGRALIVDATQDHWSLLDVMQISQDVPQSASFEAVRSGEFDASFQPANGTVPNLNGENGPVWVKASLFNRDSETATRQVVLKFPQPHSVVFFVEEKDSNFIATERGSAAAISDALGGRFPNARISIPAGETRDVYIRIESPSPILIPLQAYSQDGFSRAMTLDYLIFGLLVGCLLAVAAYSCLTFLATRERAFGWFVLFSVGAAGYILTATGIAKAVIYPGLAFNSNAVLMVAQATICISSALFLASYTNLRSHRPSLHKLTLLIAVTGAMGVLGVVLPNALAFPLLALSVLVGPTLLFGITVFLAIRGIQSAKTLLVGWTLLQVGTVWIFLRGLDLVPYTEANHYAWPLAATFTALHFSWALTSRARKAEHQAKHDALTGLPNRFGLAAYDREFANFDRKVAAVLQIDLDGFKQVNDRLGHAAGDHVLKEVADRFRAVLRDDGDIFRLGGDEFVVIVSRKRNSSNLVALANRLIVSASQPMKFRGEFVRVGASIGIAIPGSGDAKLSQVLESADAALYDAKRDGKGCLKFFDLNAERKALSEALATKAA